MDPKESESTRSENFSNSHRPGPTEEELLNIEEGGKKSPDFPGTSPPAEQGKAPESHLSQSAQRITTVKSFYAQCTAQGIENLDQRITRFLRDNPTVHVKQIKTASSDIDSRPHLIVWLWY